MLRLSSKYLMWLGGAASTPSLGSDIRNPQGQFVNVIAEGTQSRISNRSSSSSHSRSTAAHFHPTATPYANQALAQSPELRQVIGKLPIAKRSMSKWNRVLRADVYDELLKLPLRYALHDFDKLQAHMHHREAAVVNPESEGIYRYDDVAAEGNAAAAHDYYAVSGKHSSVGYAPPLGPADPLDTIPFFVHRSSNGLLPGKIYSMHPRNLMPAFYMRIQGIEGDLFRAEEELMKIFPTKKIFVRSHSLYVYNVGVDGKMVLHHWMLGLGF